MKISKSEALKLAKEFKINLDNIDKNEWYYGLNVELEHGNKLGSTTNITGNNLKVTAKIVIAHLIEFPDYYKRLRNMESQAEKFWNHKNKGKLFVK